MALVYVPQVVLADTDGPNSASTITSDSSNSGDAAWVNPGNAAANDDADATSDLDASETTYYLNFQDFGFSIPEVSTIEGIKVEVEQGLASGIGCKSDALDSSVYLLKAGNVVGENKATNTTANSGGSYDTYGGEEDLWGTTWTYSQINASNFGLVLEYAEDGGDDCEVEVDHVQITIYYTPYISEGPNDGGTFVSDDSIGTDDWSNPSNASASDDTFTIAGLDDETSEYLVATNFSFSIPDGATIRGIKARVEKHGNAFFGSPDDEVDDYAVRIVKAGTIGSTDRSDGGWSVFDTVDVYGSGTDLWGLSWTADDINASNFGFAIAGTTDGDQSGYIDHITLQVYYSAAESSEPVPDLHEWAMIIVVMGGVYYLYREGVFDAILQQY